MGQRIHKRWIVEPSAVEKRYDPPPLLDYDPVYVAEIMRYYHSRNTVPNLLPENYKAYLLAVGLAELLPGAYEEYVVFSAAGGEVARAANRFSHAKTRGKKLA